MAVTDPYISYNGPTDFPNTDCTPTALPAPSFSDCPEGYVLHEGEILKVHVSPAVWDDTDKNFQATTVPADHTVGANFDVAGITTLIGFGDKPLAETITVPITRNVLKTVNRKHLVNFDFTDLTAANYETLRGLQGTHHVALWYETIEGYIFGGANGIIARIASAGHNHTRGENALLTGQVSFEWLNLFDPPMDELDGATSMKAGKVQAPAPLGSQKKKPAAEAA